MSFVRSPPASLASSTTTERSNEFWQATPILLTPSADLMDKPISPSTCTFPTKIPNQIPYQSKSRNFSLPLAKAESCVSSSSSSSSSYASSPSPPLFAAEPVAIVTPPLVTNQTNKKEEPRDGIRKFFRKRSMSFGLKKGGPGSRNRSEGDSSPSEESIPSVPNTPELYLSIGQSNNRGYETDGGAVRADQVHPTGWKEADTYKGSSRTNPRWAAQPPLVVSTALNDTLSGFSFPSPSAASSYPPTPNTSADEPISPRTTIVEPRLYTASGRPSISQSLHRPSTEITLAVQKEEPEHVERLSLAPTSPSSSSFSDELDAEIHFGEAKKLEWSLSERINQVKFRPSTGKEDKKGKSKKEVEEREDEDAGEERRDGEKENGEGEEDNSDQASDTSSMIDFDFFLWLPSARRDALPSPTSVAGTSRIQASFGSTSQALDSDSAQDPDPKPNHKPRPLDLLQSTPGSLSWSVSSKSSEYLASPLISEPISNPSSGRKKTGFQGRHLIDSPDPASPTSLRSTGAIGRHSSEEHSVDHSAKTFDGNPAPFVPVGLSIRGLGISGMKNECYEYTDTSTLAQSQLDSTEILSDLYRELSMYDLVGKDKEMVNSTRRLEFKSEAYGEREWNASIEGEGLDEEEELLEFDAAVWPMPPLREVWVEKQSGRKNSLLVTPLEETFECFPPNGIPLQARERLRRSSL